MPPSPLIQKLLTQRGITSEEAIQKFLYGTLKDIPDPFLLPDMAKSIERLLRAIEIKERIVLFGDYDVDGITGTAQLFSYLREIGAESIPLLPHRMKEGYGLTQRSVEKILKEKPDLLITIDNGTKSKEEISKIKGTGCDIIIIDHHETPTPDSWPPVVGLINPKREDSQFPDKSIASAGLVFLFLIALRATSRKKGLSPPNLKRYLDLACLGTIADVIPLLGVNRLLVKFGLEELTKSARLGIQTLKDVSKTEGVVTPTTVSFRLAPRINAAGRLDDPTLALKLLTCQNQLEAITLGQKIESLNLERQRIQEKVLNEAIEIIENDPKDRKGVVVAKQGWHLGVVGIIAAKLTERFHAPSVVLSISEDGTEAKGSARTVPGVSVYNILKRLEEQMSRFGGHHEAAGMSLPIKNLKSFIDQFDQSTQEELKEETVLSSKADATLPLSAIDFNLLEELSLLQPHGAGNRAPTFVAESIQLQNFRIVGKNHLKTEVRQKETVLEGISFGWGEDLATISQPDFFNILFSPEFNEWNGTMRIQLKMKSIQPSTNKSP